MEKEILLIAFLLIHIIWNIKRTKENNQQIKKQLPKSQTEIKPELKNPFKNPLSLVVYGKIKEINCRNCGANDFKNNTCNYCKTTQ